MTPDNTAERYVLARGIFAGPSLSVSDDLYAVAKGVLARERQSLRLSKGGSAHTNTYFGRFAAAYWQRWTTVREVRVTVHLDVQKSARVRLAASDIAGHRRVVDAIEVQHSGAIELVAPLDMYLDGGALWLEFEARGGTLGISELAWTACTASARDRQVAIAICTFNRADDCANTVAALAGDEVVLDLVHTVLVVDQGTDLVNSREVFTDAAARLGDKLNYLRQPNLGGAGGFSRGMYEVSAMQDELDVILMDDDIMCEPETVLRLNAFANFTTNPTLVGAQMLFLYNPDYLNIGAEEVHLNRLLHGRKVAKALRNTSMLAKRQERRVDAQYQAWWTCLIPHEVLDAVGLPLPLFFQWDDVEFGVRAREHGFVTVTLPNAAVWHQDFYWKDYDDWARFFSSRNSLVVASLHADLDPKNTAKLLWAEIGQHLVAMQYGLVDTMLSGIEAFLDGPEALKPGGTELLPKIRQARAAYPETVKHDIADAPIDSSRLTVHRAVGEPSREGLVLIKRAIKQWLGKVIPGPVAITREDAYWWHVSLFDEVVVTDASQSGVRLRKRDKALAKKLVLRTRATLRRLQHELPGLQQQYRDAFGELTSRESWARRYGID